VTATITASEDVDTLTMAIEVDYEPIVGLLPTPSQLHGTFTMMVQEQ
jgi:hypothetical protein